MNVCAKPQTMLVGTLLYLEQDLEAGQHHLAHLHHTAHVLACLVNGCIT